ncbi:MAG: DUF4337 family protein [Myxococcota bacterium]
MSPEEKEAEEKEKSRHDRFEASCGLIIAVLAAALAITDIGSGRYGDDELIANSRRASDFQWYQSKSVKGNLAESERDLLSALLTAQVIQPDARPAIEKRMTALTEAAERYDQEKKEILLGSAAVGEENWVQDIDGEMGKLVGAVQWEARAAHLESVGDIFDFATFFLQISLVMGAVALLVDAERLQILFRRILVGLGVIGSALSVMAFLSAMVG